MKPSHIILIILVVVILGGFVWWVSADHSLPRIPVGDGSPTYPDQTSWKTYKGEGITFRYPSDWNVERIYYTTPAQEAQGIPLSVIAHRIFPGTKVVGKDFIDIGGRQVDCKEQSHTKCVTIETLANFVFTDSTNSEILITFDSIVATIQP